MKKLLLSGLVLTCLAAPAFADNDAKAFGSVVAVNASANSFSVKGDDGVNYQFYTNEETEIEKERDFWFDEKLKLAELKTGDRVKVEYYTNNPDYLLVDEVEVLRRK